MKRRMSIRITLAMLLALALILAGCSDKKGNSTATVYVQGAAASTVARDIAGGGFGAGDVYVNSEPITDQLEPSTQTDNLGTGTNDQLFEATIENVPETITLRVDPLPGFVFNEWKLNTWLLRRSNLGWDAYLDLLLTEAESHSENLTVAADKAQYYIATFERGFYIELGTEGSGGDGTKGNPYKSFDDAINALSGMRFDEEITFKIAGGSSTAVLDLSKLGSMKSIYRDDDELEEIRILGGYESTYWNKVGRSRFKLGASGYTGDLEEMEIASVAFDELDFSQLYRSGIEELELSDVSARTVKAAGDGIVANVVITETAPSGATFINCVVPSYDSNSTYIHSMIVDTDNTGVSNVKGGNNIIISASSGASDSKNIYLPSTTAVDGYVLTDPSAVDGIMDAGIYKPDIRDDDELEDLYELLEEDIAGRERPYDDDVGPWMRSKVSYGPYEYLDLEKWDNDWKEDIFEDWDDRWDDWD